LAGFFAIAVAFGPARSGFGLPTALVAALARTSEGPSARSAPRAAQER
jgi:hypothetical protein